MERGLLVQKFIGQGVLGTAALYSALAVHFILGLSAFYERRRIHWTPAELIQLLLAWQCRRCWARSAFAIMSRLPRWAMRRMLPRGLRGLCKELDCEAVVSEEVLRLGGYRADALPRHEARLRGRTETVAARLFRSIGDSSFVPAAQGV